MFEEFENWLEGWWLNSCLKFEKVCPWIFPSHTEKRLSFKEISSHLGRIVGVKKFRHFKGHKLVTWYKERALKAICKEYYN